MNTFQIVRSKGISIRHKTYVRLFSRAAPFYLVNEYPKSGGTWLANMVAETLELPFRTSIPIKFEKAVTHGHFLSSFGLHNVVVIWRDPRDVFVSYYFHCYFRNEKNNGLLVQNMKSKYPFKDYSDIKSNLPIFISRLINKPYSPSFTWHDFAANWSKRNDISHTSYRSLRKSTETELARIVYELSGYTASDEQIEKVVENHSFTNAKKRSENLSKKSQRIKCTD